ncbi:hypothetical protein DD238_007593 [Peronospora effusa]|uniref:FYVE-type domain-containing protein n=1 Tax=Peronospora effusa TaxID=542832 RepID=A0A3M6V9U2_9STRA|nr:hypothetical protein DD238_007593 [Peronospora effusa]
MTECPTFPFSEFPCLNFSKKQQEELASSSDDLIEKTLKIYDDFHGTSKPMETTALNWKLVRRQKSLNVYKERNTKIKSNEDRRYLCSGLMPGSIEDMIDGAYADDMESMRIRSSILMHMFLDARIVQIFEKNPLTSSVIFSGIKWMALKTSIGPSLIHARDFLYYNRLGRIIDTQGRYFVYCIMKSVEVAELPPNQDKMKRGVISLCYLFRQFQEELVGCFMIGTTSMGGTLPRSVVQVIMVDRMLAVQKYLVIARAKAYSARITNSTDQIPSTSNSCDVCMKKPKMLRSSLKLCMGCRRNTCRKCREWCTVFRLDSRTQKPGKERFCTQCISDVTRPTMSNIYMCSLKDEYINSSTHNQDSSSASMESGPKHSSSPSSSRSQEILNIDPDAWLSASPDLDNLANFVERASVANSKDMQWNQGELEYYIDILQESGHVNVSQCMERKNSCNDRQRMQSYRQDFDPPSHYKDTYAEDDTSVSQDRDQKFFSVDDLD